MRERGDVSTQDGHPADPSPWSYRIELASQPNLGKREQLPERQRGQEVVDSSRGSGEVWRAGLLTQVLHSWESSAEAWAAEPWGLFRNIFPKPMGSLKLGLFL